MSWRAVISGIDGASRTSSVLGLKVRPKTATVLPRSTPANEIETFRAMARLRVSLTLSTASRMRIGTSWSCAVLISARTSLGKHEPPKPGPACRNFGPIRLSSPMPRATSCTSAPTFSARSAISLIKVIFVARNALAAYLISSAVGRPVELVHKLARARIGGADDDTVGKLEIADSSAFAEELWVGHDGIVGVGASFADDALNLIARAYGNCRLCYDDGESVEGARDLARSVIDETQICEPVAATRRSADRNEYSIGFGHRTAEFRREF